MKRVIKIEILLSIVCCLIFISCDKFNEINQADNNAEIITKSQVPDMGRQKWSAKEKQCIEVRYDCHKNIDVYGAVLKDFISIIENNDSQNTITFIDKNFEELTTYIDAEFLKAVKSEKLTLSIVENKKVNINYIIFKYKENEEVFYVYPIVSK
ncbi:MAG: hypothetical protein LBQ22_03255 [Bacteroidales bacterium]|jgi:hypothetical protein|nr:hypothetical protein [Bacteroidales bacterium]